MAKKDTKQCGKCGEIKESSQFYVSYSELHHDSLVPYCKSCLSEYDFHEMSSAIEICRSIDKPFKLDLYKTSLLKGKDNPLGKYMRMIILNSKLDTFKNSDGITDEVKTITRMNTEILRKEKELEELEEKTKSVKKEDNSKIPDELISKWGKGYSSDEYDMFETKFKLIEQSYPLKSTMHFESLKLYTLYACRAEMAIREGDAEGANKWGKLQQAQATQAKITPQHLSSADLSQGLDNFSSLAIAVEKAVDIIPLIPMYIEKGQDKADMMILFYVNYERKLKGLPEVTHGEVYEFYNEMIASYVENNPDDYSFLLDGDDSVPLVNRVYDWVFNVRIPREKKEHPNDPFYQNLEKWVTLVSYLKWYPDAFYTLITPKEGGIRLGLDQCIMLRGLARFKHLYDVQGRGSGKCVAYDAMLFTEDGMIEIGSLFDYKKLDNSEEIINQNIGILNRYGKIENSNKGIISGYKKTKKITTREGISIEASLNHPLLIMNKDGILEYKESKDLKIGDFLCINRNNDIWGKTVDLDVDMDKYISSINGKDIHKYGYMNKNLPTTLTKELSLILGYLVGDGTLTREDIMLFSSKDDDMVERYISFMEDKIGVKVKRRKTEIDYVSYGKYYREYFRQLGLNKVDAFGKEIPECILKAPREYVVEFIKGLFDTDGCVEKNLVSFCTASEKLSKQVQNVLLNFGIISKRYKKKNKQYNTDAYIISISGENVDKYYRCIGFSCGRKQKKLEDLCSNGKVKNTNVNIIPHQKNNVVSLYEKARAYNNSDFGRSIKHVRNGANQLTYDKLKSLIYDWKYDNCEKDGLENFKELYELNYFYSPITEIMDSENYVCDLQMPETHSFIGNGIVNHNTFIQQLYSYHCMTFFPNINISMSAQTLSNASSLVKDKYNEIMKFYPLLKNECNEKECRFTENNTYVSWKSGASLTTLANAQSSKGNRKHRMTIEESAQVNEKLYEDNSKMSLYTVMYIENSVNL